jgi:hypothetical protein
MGVWVRKRLGLLLLGILWAVFITEVALRVMMSQAMLPQKLPADVFSSHPIGWALEPNLDTTIFGMTGFIEFQTNAQGWRDSDYPLERNSKARLIVLGDSFTLALETPQEQTFHHQLEALYDDQVEVISLGVSGYELAQYLLSYQEVGRSYQPDRVLVMLYVGNDLVGNLRWPDLPYYDFDTQGALQRYQFPYDGPFNLPLVTSQRSTWLMRQSKLAFVIGSLLRQPPRPDQASQVGYCEYWAHNNFPNVSPEQWRLAEALLAELQRAIQADGASLWVAIIPTELQTQAVERAAFEQECQRTFLPVDALQHDLLARLEAMNIPSLDLLPALTADPVGPLLYIAGDDIHWTPEGHTKVAQALYDWLPTP